MSKVGLLHLERTLGYGSKGICSCPEADLMYRLKLLKIDGRQSPPQLG